MIWVRMTGRAHLVSERQAVEEVCQRCLAWRRRHRRQQCNIQRQRAVRPTARLVICLPCLITCACCLCQRPALRRPLQQLREAV